jgi:hypothetical protein
MSEENVRSRLTDRAAVGLLVCQSVSQLLVVSFAFRVSHSGSFE